MKLSVLVPGIRTENWKELYNSVQNNIKHEFEFIFVGPYALPDNLKKYKNIQHIIDWGTPIRCQQIALTRARGEYITWAADDGVFCNNALNIAIDTLKVKDYKTLVMGKYQEGGSQNKAMLEDWYYVLTNHDASLSEFIPKGTLMLNVGVVPRELLLEIGGWDCQFEVCPMSYNDLAIRLQRYGCKFIIQQETMFKCGHMPGHMGDHGPIHDGQVLHDQPLFNKIYSDKTSESRTIIQLNNWVDSPKRWTRRFGDGG